MERQRLFGGPRGGIPTGGFTLIELMVVMVMIVTLSTLLMPHLPDITGARLKTAARKLAGVMTHVYDRAAAGGMTYRLTFDMDKSLYYVSRLNRKNAFEETELPFVRRTSLPTTLSFSEIRTNSQGRVKKGEANIFFFPGGLTEPTALHLRNSAGEEMTLLLHPLTGRVKIKKGYVDIPNHRV